MLAVSGMASRHLPLWRDSFYRGFKFPRPLFLILLDRLTLASGIPMGMPLAARPFEYDGSKHWAREDEGMRIVFYGDSLTEGIPGVSVFAALEARLPEHELTNCGKGGDTVTSLHHRIARSELRDPVDIAVLWVGVNDVLAKLTSSHSLLKRLMRQPRAKDLAMFRDAYGRTLELLQTRAGKILAVSPLLIGEDLSNPWNREIENLCKSIASVSASFDHVHYLDLRAVLIDRLKGERTTDYVPKSVTGIACEALFLRTLARVDAVASNRGLRFTLDGVHLNSRGVEVVREAFVKAIRDLC